MPSDRRKRLESAPIEHTTIAFAETITPASFSSEPAELSLDAPLPSSILFPDAPSTSSSLGCSPEPSSSTEPSKQAPKRAGRRAGSPSSVHIPRPPNAFILFRSSFIRHAHVGAGVERSHATLSKIIGLAWARLPPAERNVWFVRAQAALAEHKRRYPDKAPSRAKGKEAKVKRRRRVKEAAPADEERCQRIAALIADGTVGEALDEAMAEYDAARVKPTVEARFEAPLTAAAYEVTERELLHEMSSEVTQSTNGYVKGDMGSTGAVQVVFDSRCDMSYPQSGFSPSDGTTDYASQQQHLPHTPSTLSFTDPFINTTDVDEAFASYTVPVDPSQQYPTHNFVQPQTYHETTDFLAQPSQDYNMPPLVERSYTPSSLSYPVTRTAPQTGPPRLSIDTITYFDRLNVSDAPSPITPVSAGPPSACPSLLSSYGGASMPGTPVDGTWESRPGSSHGAWAWGRPSSAGPTLAAPLARAPVALEAIGEQDVCHALAPVTAIEGGAVYSPMEAMYAQQSMAPFEAQMYNAYHSSESAAQFVAPFDAASYAPAPSYELPQVGGCNGSATSVQFAVTVPASGPLPCADSLGDAPLVFQPPAYTF